MIEYGKRVGMVVNEVQNHIVICSNYFVVRMLQTHGGE